MSTSDLQPSTEKMLCYLFPPFTGFVFILVEKDKREILFHAWQSLLLGAAFFGAWLVVGIVSTIFGAVIPFMGKMIGWFIPIIKLLGVGLWIYCLYESYKGKDVRLPVIDELAQKKAGG